MWTTKLRGVGRASHPSRSGIAMMTVLAAVALAVANATPVGATFPGENGRIAYARYDPDIEDFRLFTANPDGSRVRRLSPGGGTFPDWSPTSTRIAYDFWDGGAQQLATIDPDGENMVQITSGPGIHEVPSWSPDGDKIIFNYSPLLPWEPGFFTSIYVVDSDGSDQRALGVVSPDAFDVEPKYSPDGRYVAFVRLRLDAEGNQQMAIYVMRADGSHVRRLTRWDFGVEHPKWSPDSQWIIFNGGGRHNPDSGSNRAIYLIRRDGTDLDAIYRTRRSTALTKPGFSPNGHKVLFVCAKLRPVFNENLCVMNLRGFDVRTITRTPEFEQHPAWGSATKL